MPTTKIIKEFPMPAYWASYLINGDASGITDEEKQAADAHLEAEGIVHVIDCADEAYFSWSYDLHGGICSGGDLLDYTVEISTL